MIWENPPYYLTAYGLAVKHGFTGTEKEWLASLKGEQGDGLVILGSYATAEELKAAQPSGSTGGYYRVGSSTDYQLYYWDEVNADWYSISLKGERGADGNSAYQQAVSGGYTGTEEEFNTILTNFKAWAERAASSAKSAQEANAAAQQAAKEAGEDSSQAAAARDSAVSSADTAKAAQQSAAQSEAAAADYAKQAASVVGDSSWIYFDIEEDGHLYAYTSDSFNGAEFSMSENGTLEVTVS